MVVSNVIIGRNPLQSWATIVDCGDVPLTWLDNNVALAQLDKAHTVKMNHVLKSQVNSNKTLMI